MIARLFYRQIGDCNLRLYVGLIRDLLGHPRDSGYYDDLIDHFLHLLMATMTKEI